jgi:hypothetical protein
MAAPDRKGLKNAAMADIRIVEAILRRWDPIGVEPGTLGPADEYDNYAPHIVSMVNSGCKVEELASHLENLAVVTIGIGPSSASSRAHSLDFASQIVGHLRRDGNSTERPHEE